MRTITRKHIWLTLLKCGIFLLVTAVLLAVAAGAALFVIARGPSADASARLAATLSEAGSPLAGILFSDAELAEVSYYAAPKSADADIVFETDENGERTYDYTPTVTRISSGAWEGVILEGIDVRTLELCSGNSADTVKKESGSGAVGILFADADLSLIGERFNYRGDGSGYNVCGIDGDGILRAGRFTAASIFNSGWKFAVSADRVLINGGIPCTDLGGGYSARAAIGQKADGSIIIVLLIPRGIFPRGATYDELASIMYEYGALTAAALTPSGVSIADGSKIFSAGGGSRYTVLFNASFSQANGNEESK